MTWRPHPVFTQYEVSSGGQVRLIGKMAPRKTRPDRYGYARINLVHQQKLRTVHTHTLVADTFLRLGLAGETVNHIDGDKSNNTASNLEWISPSENTSHSFRTGQRVHKNCHPIIVDGRRFYSKRAAERETGVPRRSFKDGPHFQLTWKAYP